MADEDDSSAEEFARVARIVALTAGYYSGYHLCKQPCRTSALTGAAWVAELEEENPTRIFNSFRMGNVPFVACARSSRKTHRSLRGPASRPMKKWECFSTVCPKRLRMKISKNVSSGVVRPFTAPRYIVRPKAPSPELAANPMFAGQFANCRLAFDGTHIPAFVSDEDAKPYRDRTGKLSQNVFAACTFDMHFAFVLAGWEGSAADSTVLSDARRKGFVTPPELFDLGDAGYGLSMEVMTPYRGVRYHLREWGQANLRPQNYKELYNLRHAQARNVIEKIFGVLKRRFPILQLAPEHSVATQAKIVLACCVLHNFIRRQNDPEDDPEGELEGDYIDAVNQANTDPANNLGVIAADAAAKKFRDELAVAMWNAYC